MINLIPVPREYTEDEGYLYLGEEFGIESEIDLPLLEIKPCSSPVLSIKRDGALDEDEYKLVITKENITIRASAQLGAYYALQSLRQLSRYELGVRRIPCCTVSDKPEYKWRGLQLDESRHFFGKEEVKRLLDMMFMLKLNVFHWHLTDDQGWRIEIKKYPLLTEIGSVRDYTQIGGWNSTSIVNERYSGFYTQEDIKEIVGYAAQRGIMIVPEIDFPAHCASAIAAYPWLACRELDRNVPGYFGGAIPEKRLKQKDWNRTICLGKDKVTEFVLDVLDEVCGLFPAPYFHIGGDEAPKDEWQNCPLCQERIRSLGLDGEDGLHGYFNNTVLEHLKKHGKRMIGWNDILRSQNLDKSAVVQYWTPKRDRRAEQFVNSGGNLIMSNHKSFYFDMTYAQYPLDNTYGYSIADYGVKPENRDNILGLEGELWSEWIDGREKLDFNLHPRAEALAEVAWSPQGQRNFEDFLQRLDRFKDFLDYLKVGYAADKSSMPKNPALRINIRNKFLSGDTHMELKLNRKYKAQGER
jgi:hexosaminidase